MGGCAVHLAASLDGSLVEFDGHQGLADLVVEITADLPPLVFLDVHELCREPLEIALVLTLLQVLLANPRLQTAGIASREERNGQTQCDRDPAGPPDALAQRVDGAGRAPPAAPGRRPDSECEGLPKYERSARAAESPDGGETRGPGRGCRAAVPSASGTRCSNRRGARPGAASNARVRCWNPRPADTARAPARLRRASSAIARDRTTRRQGAASRAASRT